MATDAIITLNRLRCIRESDASDGSEPYIWPALLWIDDYTLDTDFLVRVITPVRGNARVVIRSDMRAGQTADIPVSVGVLRVRLEDNQERRNLILVVALWEKDETPEAAMRAGFQAYSSELRAAIADNLFRLADASEEELAAIIAEIKDRVFNRVKSAIENGLTGWQKARVFVGTLNLDDIIDSSFNHFDELVSEPITLTFGAGSSNNYEIQGELQARPVPIELCQPEIDRVKAAQERVKDIDDMIKDNQSQLDSASPNQKIYINSEISRLKEEDLPAAMAVLEEARRSLQACRVRRRPLLSPGGLVTAVHGTLPTEHVGEGNNRAFKGQYQTTKTKGDSMMQEKQSLSNKGTSFDGFNDFASARAIAISAGDLSVVVRREVKKTLEKNRNNILGSLNTGLEELLKRELISAQEYDNLKDVCKHLLYSIRGKENGEEAFFAIRAVYHDMLTNQQSTPTALAIASVATSAFNLKRSSSVEWVPETAAAGGVGGAIIGSVVGGIIGGGLGATLGAAIGGAAGAAIGWCNETGNGNE